MRRMARRASSRFPESETTLNRIPPVKSRPPVVGLVLALAVCFLAYGPGAPARADESARAGETASCGPAESPAGTADKKPVKRCYKCGGTGKLDPAVDPPPDWILRDSHYFRTDPDGGVGFSLCTRTPNPEAEAEYRKIRDRNAKWLETIDEYETVTGTKVVAVEGRHLNVYLELPKLKIDGKRVDQARGARRYLDLLTRVNDRYLELFGVTREEDERKHPRHTVYIHKDQDTFNRYLKHRYGRSSQDSAGYKYVSPGETSFSTRRLGEADIDVEQRVVYSLAFLLLFKYDRPKDVPPWLQLGFGSFLEHDFYGNNRNFTFIEVPPDDSFRGADSWKKKIKREVIGGDFVKLVEIHDRDKNAFGWRDAAYAFGYTAFLIDSDVEKFREFVRVLKRTDKDSMAAIQQVYGWLPQEIDDAFREHVLKRF